MTSDPGSTEVEEPTADPTDLPDDTPEPEPGDDTVEVPVDEVSKATRTKDEPVDDEPESSEGELSRGRERALETELPAERDQ